MLNDLKSGRVPMRLQGCRPAILFAVTLTFAAIAAVFVYSGNSALAQSDAAAAPVAALTVTSAVVQLRQWPSLIEANGSVAAWQEASVGTVVGGLRVIEVLADVGDSVRRGARLARFDLDTLRAQQTVLRADLAQARALAQRAEADLVRADTLHGGGAISEQDVLQYKTQAVTTQAQVAAAQAHLDAQDLLLRQAQIVAPDDGVITARTAALGAVEPAGQELFRLIRRNRLQWQGEVTASQIGAIHAGQHVRITLPDGSAANATVARIAPDMQTQSRLGTVYAELEAGSSARAGMFAAARIELPSSPAFVVPAVSIIVRDGHSLVAVIEKGHSGLTVAIRHVTTGRRVDSEVEILDGISAGDQVVASGANFLGDGDLVKLSGASHTYFPKG